MSKAQGGHGAFDQIIRREGELIATNILEVLVSSKQAGEHQIDVIDSQNMNAS